MSPAVSAHKKKKKTPAKKKSAANKKKKKKSSSSSTAAKKKKKTTKKKCKRKTTMSSSSSCPWKERNKTAKLVKSRLLSRSEAETIFQFEEPFHSIRGRSIGAVEIVELEASGSLDPGSTVSFDLFQNSCKSIISFTTFLLFNRRSLFHFFLYRVFVQQQHQVFHDVEINESRNDRRVARNFRPRQFDRQGQNSISSQFSG